MRWYSKNSVVSLLSGVQPPHWAPPVSRISYKITAFQPFTRRKSEVTRSLAPAKLSREISCAKKPGVCVRRRRWSITLAEVYHVLKFTRRSAKSDLGVFATCVAGAHFTACGRIESCKFNPRHSKFFRTSVRTSLTSMGLRRVSQATKDGLHPPRHFLCGSRRCTPTQEGSALICATRSTFISPTQPRLGGDEHRVGAASEFCQEA